jgi:hypothetical protein
MDLDELREILAAFAREEPVRADLFRTQADDQEPKPTGGFVIVGQSDGQRFMEVRGIEGELPANVRIVEDAVLASSSEEPNDWQALDGAEADSLRVFTLLDPGILADQIQRAEFSFTENGETIATVHVDLASFPRLPEAFINWLRGDAVDRVIELHLKEDRILEITQPDIHPRRSDRITERFAE